MPKVVMMPKVMLMPKVVLMPKFALMPKVILMPKVVLMQKVVQMPKVVPMPDVILMLKVFTFLGRFQGLPISITTFQLSAELFRVAMRIYKYQNTWKSSLKVKCFELAPLDPSPVVMACFCTLISSLQAKVGKCLLGYYTYISCLRSGVRMNKNVWLAPLDVVSGHNQFQSCIVLLFQITFIERIFCLYVHSTALQLYGQYVHLRTENEYAHTFSYFISRI